MAFLNGRAEKNPADDWYQSELGFFDFYVIPLAKKLKDCGVFGVSSDEYLDYAISNRKGKRVDANEMANATETCALLTFLNLPFQQSGRERVGRMSLS